MDYNPYQAQIEAINSQISQAETMLTDPEMAEMAQAEIDQLKSELKQIETAASEFSQKTESSESGSDQPIGRKCTLEFRAGAGGDEAKIWADDLKRMYMRFAEQQKLKVTVVDDLIIQIKGNIEIEKPESEEDGETLSLTTYEFLQNESGVHRVQRVPATESQGRIHTSTATVAVLPEVPKHAVKIREEDLEWQFIRSSGAGGQSVNKTNSAVRLTHKSSGIAVSARSERKQVQNREIALQLLRSQLWEIEEEKRQAQIGTARSAIGRARRSEKIRTYNYPQNRITDHRTKQSWHNLPNMLDGDILKPLSELYWEVKKQESES